MPDQEGYVPVMDVNQIETSLRANRYSRSVLDPEASPEQIRKRYLAREGQYFFRDRNNALAFEDRGARIATRTEDPVVAASMVDLAVAKGWKELKITGSESFRRAIWLEAAKRGMSVRGYEPQAQDELQLQEIKLKQKSVQSLHDLGPSRAKAFTEQNGEEAIKTYPELEKAYAGRTAIHKWIDRNIPDPDKQTALRSAVDKGVVERLNKGEIPTVVVVPAPQNTDSRQAGVIHKQAIVMGAVARAKGLPPEKVNIVIAAAERIGRHLADKGAWIPEPMVYDRIAPPRSNPSIPKNESEKPEIRRQPKIQLRR